MTKNEQMCDGLIPHKTHQSGASIETHTTRENNTLNTQH